METSVLSLWARNVVCADLPPRGVASAKSVSRKADCFVQRIGSVNAGQKPRLFDGIEAT